MADTPGLQTDPPAEAYSDDEWTEILNKLGAVCGITIPPANQLAVSDIRALLTSNAIASTITGVPETAPPQGIPPLRYQHVEPLLEQAASLIERAIQADTQLFRLRVEQFQARLEVLQFYALDKIAGDEVASGSDLVSFQQVNGEHEAQKAIADQDSELKVNYDLLVAPSAADLTPEAKTCSFGSNTQKYQVEVTMTEAGNSIMPYFGLDSKTDAKMFHRTGTMYQAPPNPTFPPDEKI